MPASPDALGVDRAVLAGWPVPGDEVSGAARPTPSAGARSSASGCAIPVLARYITARFGNAHPTTIAHERA
jgi:hypothetical protein